MLGKMLRLTSLALVAGTLFSVASVDTAVAQDRRVYIVNRTGQTMMNFYASRTSTDSWEEDILGDSVLRNGERVRVNIDDGTGACAFDFKAVLRDGRKIERYNINVCTTSEYVFR
jgi:hypothetical protein